MENKKKYLYGFLVALLIMGFGLFGASNAGLFKGSLVLTSPTNTSITKHKTLAKQLDLCGEDYNPVEKAKFFSRTLYNGFEQTYSKWLLCKLDVNVQPLEEQTCPNGWRGPFRTGPYTYSCSKTSTQEEFSLNWLSCGTNYNISKKGVTPRTDNPSNYIHKINCSKKGERPVNAPCPLEYEARQYVGPEADGSVPHVLCGKR